jgi:peptidoglycan/LPS O-acetylase OafA/YrhL
MNYVLIYILIIATTVITAYISYEFYEKKLLKLKEKFATVESTNTKNMAKGKLLEKLTLATY